MPGRDAYLDGLLGGSDDPSNLVELTFREHKAVLTSPPGTKLKGFSGGPALAG